MIKDAIQKNIFFIIIFVFIIVPFNTRAADIEVSSKTVVDIGEAFEAKIVFDTKETINAIEGEVVIPDIFEIKNINYGNSIINFWVEAPKQNNQNERLISFSGIIPGGFYGQGEIVSIFLVSKESGQAKINLNNVKVLLNSESGILANLKAVGKTITTTNKNSDSKFEEVVDTENPEGFKPEIARSEDLNNGEWVVVFTTQDKKSGIDYYEIKESRYPIFSFLKNFEKAESPYSLKDQGARSYVYVRAVDKQGNKTTERAVPPNPIWLYENILYLVIIVAGIYFIFFKKNEF